MNSTDFLSDSYQTDSLTLREVLESSNFEGTHVLAGAAGLDRVVSSVNVMENPDIIPWVKPSELLITVGYSLQGRDNEMAELIESLDARDVAGFGVKLGPYITKVEPDVLEIANQRDFPLLALPPAVSFDDLISDVYEARDSLLLGGLHRKSDREQELMYVALGGGGPVQVAKRLAELVDCEVLVLGLGNEVIAHHNGEEGRYHDVDPQENSQFDDAVSAPIVFGSTYVGRLYVFPGDLPGTRFFPGLVPRSAQIMALAASREIAVASVDRQFRAEFLEQALLNRLSRSEVARRCQALEWSMQFPAVVATLSPASLEASANVERVRDMLGWALRGGGIHAPHAIIDGDVVALVGQERRSGETPEAIAHDAVSSIISRPAIGTWSAGISRVVDNATGLPHAWDQAQIAAKVIRSTKGVGATGKFSDLGVYRLLSEVDQGLLNDFAKEALGELFDPVGGKAELRRTLAVLLETNLNVAQTARELHYHYNSVRYRTAQLEKILGPFLTDSTRRLELHVALLICDMVADSDAVEGSEPAG